MKKKRKTADQAEGRQLEKVPEKIRVNDRVGVNQSPILPNEKQMQKERPRSKVKATGGRHWTVSLALPGSIIDNAQSAELRSYLAGQIARALVIFNVDEVIVFGAPADAGHSTSSTASVFLARLLQYLETPQYLRRSLFPMHPDLKFAGLLNPLDCPHHMRMSDQSEYREAVVASSNNRDDKMSSLVNAGLQKEVPIDRQLPVGTRLTIKLNPQGSKVSGVPVSPEEPRKVTGTYWGYSTRVADSFMSIWTECPYEGGYDLNIGTSEHGTSVTKDYQMPQFKHLLLVFGGVEGLEAVVAEDQSIQLQETADLFDQYINVCPDQGSRTIRTEEAILIAMSALRPAIVSAN